jgi:LysM repeat protein
MSVFKDDHLVAKVLGHPRRLKRRNAVKWIAIGCGMALVAVASWMVYSRKYPGMASASANAAPSATSTSKPEPAQPEGPAAPAASKELLSWKPTLPFLDKKHLPPVIEEVRVEAAELNPRYAVRLVEKTEESAGHKPVEAAKNVSGNAAEMFEQAKKIEDSTKGTTEELERARALYQKALESGTLQAAQETHCLTRLNDLTTRLILDPKAHFPEGKAQFHKVEPGEVAERIARKYKVNIGQLKRINHLNDKLIVRVGQTLKLLPGEVLFRVDKEKLTGTLYIDGVYIKRYPIGIGPGNATPKGAYTVENKLIHPDWYYEGKKVPFGDPKNILGTRWMGMANTVYSANGAGLGVHGTSLPETVPGRESKGCVRLRNEDVEELYDFMPQGGKIIID